MLRGDVHGERLFVDHQEAIEGAIRLIVRRNHLAEADAEEFASRARLKLVENDYEVLRRFQKRSSLTTFLFVVLQRVLIDYRVSNGGRWRPSAEARRLGPVAIRLEELVSRDGLSLDQAIEMLRTDHRIDERPAVLRGIAEQLPPRFPRRRWMVDEDGASRLPDDRLQPDQHVSRERLRPSAVRVRTALEEAVNSLPTQDQLIVRLRFREELSIADIARALHLEAKPLYRRFEQVLRRLRTHLEASDVESRTIGELLEMSWCDLIESDGTHAAADPGGGHHD